MKNVLSVISRGQKDKSTRVNRDWTEARKVNAQISLKELLVKEFPSSLEDGEISDLSVLTDPANEDSTRIKQKIRILDHLKNLVEVLRASFAIVQGLTWNNITTGPKQYRFTRTFLYGEALRIFDLKSAEERHETIANLILAMNHVLTYFGPK